MLKKQRKYLIVADMIIAGEKEGPVCPSPKKIGAIAMGENPVIFDSVISRLMGMKEKYFSTLNIAKGSKGKYRLIEDDVKENILSNDTQLSNKKIEEIKDKDIWYFIPTSGWEEAFKCRKEE